MSDVGRVFGIAELEKALTRLAVEGEVAAMRIVKRGQAVVEQSAKAQFTTSHTKGTKTPSAPGEPPSVVSGTLRRSIRSDKPMGIGFGGAMGRVYPTAIYARAQELGFGHLPARPYMAPGHDLVKARLIAIAREEWARI